jgi:Ca-activated chloride channel homolog
MKKLSLLCCLVVGLSISLLWSCSLFAPVSLEQLLSKISVEDISIPDSIAQTTIIPPLNDPLPKLEDFPLYGAKPNQDSNTVYVEVFSFSKKVNGNHKEEEWLVDVAEAFNQQQQQLSSQKIVQVGIRSIPTGTSARLLAAKAAKPAGYIPSNNLWLALLKDAGIEPIVIEPKLVEDCGGFIVEEKAYQQLAAGGEVTFNRLLDQILAGKLKLGYGNPYTSSSSLNLLYHIFWQAAGHAKDGKPLTISEVRSPQIASVFDTFQKQVIATGINSSDLKDIFVRNPNELQVFSSGCLGYAQLRQTPGHEKIGLVPYGIPHTNSLVGFDWNSAEQQEALSLFAKFALSAPMQQLLPTPDQRTTAINQPVLPMPSGQVLETAREVWKQRKDGNRSVYMELVIDTSGSMSEDFRLKALQDALRLASGAINRGNYVGLVTFSDHPTRLMKLAPFNELEQKRLFAAIDQLEPYGETALYDGLAVGLADLQEKQKSDPKGRFYLMLLTDGERTKGIEFDQIQDILQSSRVRIYPIAYGEVNQQELQNIAAVHEGSVYEGRPKTVQTLLKDLFQANL